MRDLLIALGYFGTTLFILVQGFVLVVWPRRPSLLGQVRGVTESNARKVGIPILLGGLIMFFLPLTWLFSK
jgi:hypothetical protein